MDKFDLKKFITEGKLLKENNDLESYYPEWAAGEVRVGNEGVIDNGGVNANLEDLPDETMETFKNYVKAVKALNADSEELRGDIAGAVSAIRYDIGRYEMYEFDVLSKDQFEKIQTMINFSDVNENESLNELDSLSNVFDTITGEYEDDEGKVVYAPYTYNDLKDLLNSTFKTSRSVDDFIEKVTYSITNTTSVLSLEDQDKLHDWYDVRSEYGS